MRFVSDLFSFALFQMNTSAANHIHPFYCDVTLCLTSAEQCLTLGKRDSGVQGHAASVEAVVSVVFPPQVQKV